MKWDKKKVNLCKSDENLFRKAKKDFLNTELQEKSLCKAVSAESSTTATHSMSKTRPQARSEEESIFLKHVATLVNLWIG